MAARANFPDGATAVKRLVLALTIALAGLVLLGQGAWIHAKAWLAQVLLERAFAETVATGRDVKPWSWADTWPVARIEVKRIGASAIVLAGSSGQALAFGPGHVELTPDAGERGVAVYSAHRDTHFRFLKDVKKGDEVAVTRRDGERSAIASMQRRWSTSINQASIRSPTAISLCFQRAGRSMRQRRDRCATSCMRTWSKKPRSCLLASDGLYNPLCQL